MPTGLLEAIISAVLSNSAYKEFRSATILLTNPILKASVESIHRPVYANSLKADSFPILLGKNCKVPKSAAIPISIYLIVN